MPPPEPNRLDHMPDHQLVAAALVRIWMPRARLAELLKVDRRTLQRLASAGGGREVRPGQWRALAEALDDNAGLTPDAGEVAAACRKRAAPPPGLSGGTRCRGR